MAVNLSPIWGAGAQLLDNSGNVLSGGKIYTYAAGTTTPAATYTSNSGSTENSNPIILNAAGRVPYEIWLTDGISYKFVLKDSNDTLIATYDNLTGINSNYIAFTMQQEIQTATAGQTVFNLTTMQYQPGTNSLSVFVDGVNQYGPGAQYAYVETDSDTVTFVNGLHVGASVKFTTAASVSSNYANAAQVTYDPPFTDAVPTNVEAKLAQTVTTLDFGAVGDGVTDDTAAIQAAINSDATVIDGLGLTYVVSAVIDVPSNKVLQNFNIDATGFSSADSFDAVFNVEGSLGSTVLLTANAVANAVGGSYPGMPTIQVADASSFAINDLIQITSNELWSASLNVGELAIITDISLNTITLSAPLFYSYTTANSGRIRKVNTVENVTFSNVTGVGPIALNSTPTQYMNFISAYCARNIFVLNCSASLFRVNTISFRMAYNCHFRDSTVFDCQGGYGVAVYDSSQNVFIIGNNFDNTRHGVTVSASNTYGGGIPNNIHVIGNSSVGRVEAIDCHPGADNVIFANNTLRCNSGEASGQGGIMFQGRNFTCVNNTVNGYANAAILCQPFVNTSGYSPNITITGNRVYSTLAGTTGAGIYVQMGNGPALKGNSCESLNISNNTVVGPFAKGVFVYTITSAITPLYDYVISGNVLKQCLIGINVRAGGQNVYNGALHGNVINGLNAPAGTSYGILFSTDAGRTFANASVIGNVISNTDNGFGLDATDTYSNIIEHKTVFNNVTQPYANIGTLTIASGVITLRASLSKAIAVDTEGGAATDDLDTINGGTTGMEIMITSANSGRDVTLKDGTGNLRLAGDFTLTSTEDIIGLYYNGTNWLEKFRSDNTV